LDAPVAASLLPDILRSFMGPVFPDIVSVTATGGNTVTIEFRQPSPFLMEALEVDIRKPGQTMVGTGAFMVEGNSTTDLRANNAYYLGPPAIDRITVANYPSVRSAWADLLRDRIDMLYEVGSDALDSMRNSNTVSLFTHTRHYQHALIFNTRSTALRSPAVRRALTLAIDRKTLVRNALRDHGIPSLGPVSPSYWALASDAPHFQYDPAGGAALLREANKKTPFRFTCLVSADSVAERIALDVKQQLAAIGVEMAVEEAPRDETFRRAAAGEYEAVITEVISGPTILRPYLVWHSQSPVN